MIFIKKLKAFIVEESKGKIKFIKKSDITNLHQIIHLENLEEKYGGKLGNFTLFWPPLQIKKEDLQNFNENKDRYNMQMKMNYLKYKWVVRLGFYLRRFMLR